LLQEHHPELEVVEVLDAIEGAMQWFDHHAAPDLIFSDIQLADGLSFELWKRTPPPCPIIFTTAYDAYMMEAFRSNGIDYLLKPIDAEDLTRSVRKFEALTRTTALSAAPDLMRLLEHMRGGTERHRERFLVTVGSKLLPVQASDVAHFCAVDGATELHTQQGKRYVLDAPLDELERQVDPRRFFRLNRQCLAQLDAIAVVHAHFNGKLKVELRPPAPMDVLVSREKARSFKEWLDGTAGLARSFPPHP
jgi:DNA-binding LytR/AlgR family response regulator